jgi:hypothetical protein
MERECHILSRQTVYKVDTEISKRPENGDSLIQDGIIIEINGCKSKNDTTNVMNVVQGLPVVKGWSFGGGR